ncbi:uncharacterized protein LOC143884812 isoform X2 [Tasmannia lanceolata]|uniref:uncharacterized protein LOC143884812 isoform X2 n=1 Tax=Tasmannia lanceolata TaxID=3420 RepID=UPI004064370F
MAKPHQTLNFYFASLVLAIFLCCFALTSSAKSSHRPISDSEIREKKNACYADIESGLWGRQCKSSIIAKENCALQCLSHTCYGLIYESDPLEEGEKDYIRSQEYKLSLGESLEGIKGSFDF